MSARARRPDRRPRQLLLCLLLAATLDTSAAAERGSAADQEACTQDVFRLCSDLIPDETQIVACLESKRDQLSPACGKVFAPAPVATPRRRRHQRAL